jgi:hypothetical protein
MARTIRNSFRNSFEENRKLYNMYKNAFKIFLMLLLLLSVSPASGQGLFEQAQQTSNTDNNGNYNNSNYLHGFIRTALYAGTERSGNDICFQSLYSYFGLNAGIKAGTYGAAYAEIRARTGFEFDEQFSSFELREGYADLYIGPLDIRAGKQILSWGASGFINPSDQFSPEDPTFRSPERDDLRMGNWALRTNLTISSSSLLQFIWLPVYQPSVLLIKPFGFPEFVNLKDFNNYTASFNESSFGFKYDLRSSLLDLELSYFNGYRNSPSLTPDSLRLNLSTFQPEELLLGQNPYRIHSAGLNITVPVGSYLFRTEGGWMKPFGNENQAISPFPELSYVFEIEQSGPNTTLIAGYYGKYILDFKKSETDFSLVTEANPDLTGLFPPGTAPDPGMIQELFYGQIEGFNRLFNYQLEEFYHAVYASATVSVYQELIDLELPGMYNFTAGELILVPSLKFNITDGLSFKAGAYFLSGKEGSLFDMTGAALNAGYALIELQF